jgi:signal transduction histidine kinase
MVFALDGGYGDYLLSGYLLGVLAICCFALLLFIRKGAGGAERKRMVYVIAACVVAAVFSLTDLLHYLGYGIPRLSDIAVAALLYFLLMVITHSELPELYEIMARALIIFTLILFSTVVFFIVIGLFGNVPIPEFTTILMASLLIVLTMDPLRLALRKAFVYLFPENKEFFTSLYGFGEELEREKSALLDEMATGLAHEIRNPLGSIKGAAQYLQLDSENEESRKLFNVIIEEVDRLNRVVSQFLNYAKPYQLNLKKQNINPVIEKAVSLIRAGNVGDSIHIETDLNPKVPPVEVDAEQMIQVIHNMAFNAIEAMPGGGTLVIRTSRIESEKGGAVSISIRDTGKGIPKKELKNIFKPFFTTRDGGTGLGLAICQRIVRNHGGYIRVKSIPGQGSVFYIRIDVVR